MQDETYSERFRALGARPEAVQVTGSMKYDGAQTDRDNPATRRLAALAGLAADDVVFLAGSTQEPEESVALQVFQQLSRDWPQLRLIIVPRHPERFDCVARMLDASGVAWQRAHVAGSGSRQGSEPASPACSPLTARLLPARVLLVDVVGELGAWWGTAHIAFVGGSLGNRGGQNMIEPAAYGAAVSFGPNTRNFRDIVAALLRARCGRGRGRWRAASGLRPRLPCQPGRSGRPRSACRQPGSPAARGHGADVPIAPSAGRRPSRQRPMATAVPHERFQGLLPTP